ncbi:MAG: hypothetical protein JWP12_902 [Bacteroidetes bacterium]|nr:hypothetical protein [Bacteroidota bacterium]
MKHTFLLKLSAAFLLLTGSTRLSAQINYFANPNQGCAPLVVTFTNASTDPSAYRYEWNFNDGTPIFIDTMPTTITHTYTTPGYYSAFLTVYNSSGGYVGYSYGGGSSIQVNGGSISTSDSACVGDAVNFCANGQLNSASWNFGDPASGVNNTSTQNCPTHTFSANGTYTVTLVANGSCGTNTVTKTIVIAPGVYPHPFLSANPNPSCPGAPVDFYGGVYTTYSWNFGDPGSGANNVSNLQTPQHIYSANGSYTATLMVTNGCGKSGSTSNTVNIVSHPPFPTQSYFHMDNSGPVCPGSYVNFNAPGGSYTFLWNFGDGSPTATTTQSNTSHYYGATLGNYNASVTITNSCGDDTVLNSVVQVGSNIGFPNQSWFSLNATPNPVCHGDAVNFEAPSGYSNYAWDYGDGHTSAGGSSHNSHPYTANGTYNVGVTITNNCGNDTTLNTSIVVNNAGSFPGGIQINASPNISCPNDIIEFEVYPSGFQSYAWDFGDGNTFTSLGERIEHAYTTTGTYNVTCVITNGCGLTTTVSGSVTITGSGPVNPDLGVEGIQNPSCPTDHVFFNVHGGQSSYTYITNYGDGSPVDTTIGSGGTHMYGTAGTYHVTVTATNGCGSTLTVSTDEVISNTAMPALVGSDGHPTWGFAGSDGDNSSGSTAGCVGDAIVFYFEGNAASNHYDFGDGTSGTAVEPFLVYGGDGTIPVTIIKHAFSATGNYLITLTLTNGCGNTVTDTMTIHIGGGLSVQGDMTTSPPPFSTCAPISLLAFGGSNYSWNFGDGGTLSTSSSSVSHTYATAGVYVVSVLVTNGCGNTATFSRSLTVTGVGGPAVSLTSSNSPTCVNGGNGSASIAVSNGQPPYSYAWNDAAAQTTATATSLPAGLYYATVTDNIGCATTFAVSIPTPAPIVPAISTTTTACGSASGTATVVVSSGGTSPYNYLWSTGITNATTTGLAAGTYSVTITDANGCSSSATASVSENGGATLALNTVTNATCNGSATGAIDINVTGGTPPYTYMWSNLSPAQDPSSLTAGNYSVTVIDNSGCHATLNATVSQPSPIAVATAVVTSPTCGNFDGKASAAASGGTGPYTYMWDSNAGNQATQTATGLPAGTYTVTITDFKGCTMDGTVDLSNSNAPNITAVVNNVSCYNGSNGAVDITVTGGTSPYLYTWSVPPPQTNHQDINSLTPGNYLVFVNDAHGCMSFRSYTVTQPSQLVAAVTNTGATCGNIDGTATATPAGGNTGFTYAWTGGQSTQTATGLAMGNYTVTVTDNKGCTATGTTSIAATTLPLEICMVTVDPGSTHNIIYWEKPSVTNIDSFRVYREDVTNVYTLIGSVAYDSLSEFHDYGADPNTTTKRYKIAVVDNCGGVSAKSNYHNTIYIVDNGLGQFTWNPLYTIENGANPVDNYALMRDDNNTGTWNQVAITAGTQNTLVDPNYATYPNGRWYVETVWGITCTPTRATVNTTRSNIKHAALMTGIQTTELSSVMLYPNPATEAVTLELPALNENTSVKIMNSLGQLVYDQNVSATNARTTKEINTSGFAKGIYTISIESGMTRVFKKLVIN